MRRGLDDLDWIMNYEILSCIRYRRFASVIFLDTDNAQLQLEQILEESIRNSDEFFALPTGYAVVMGETEKSGAIKAVERYKESTKGACDLRFGIASYPIDGKSANALLDAARKRLERARQMTAGAVIIMD